MPEKLIQRRSVKIDRAHIDEESRTVALAFSSEEPVERWFGTEILDHGSSSVRLGRLRDGGPLLMEHDTRQHVGTVESVEIGGDRKGRAVVRFGTFQAADDAWRMVQDQIKKSVSVGYMIHKIERSENHDTDEVIARVTDWEPLEISLVAIPADVSVGVDRSLKDFDVSIHTENRHMPDEIQTTETTAPTVTVTAPAAPAVDIQLERDHAGEQAAKAERHRVSEINAAAKMYPNLRDLADQCIGDGTTLEEFRGQALPVLGKPAPLPNEGTPATDLGLSRNEVKAYSLLRAIDALADHKLNGTPLHKRAGFELECSIAIADKLEREGHFAEGRERKGDMFVPFDVQQRSQWAQRAAPMDTSENSHLVGTDHLAGSFIDALRNRAVVMALGARTLNGLVGNVSIPRLDTPATWSWLAEDGSVTAGEQSTGSVTLSPKTVAGAISITRRLVKQSSPDVEQLVRNDLVTGAAIEIDAKAIEGSGASNQPTGIAATSGIATSTIGTAGQPTWAETVEFEEDVETGNALMGSLAYITTPAVKTHCKTTLKTAAVAGYIWENDTMNGYRAIASNQAAADRILFGNFEDVLMGFWGVLDLSVDPYTDAAKGGLVIRAFQDLDIAVRHAASFSKNV